jgi:hypothetical protein
LLTALGSFNSQFPIIFSKFCFVYFAQYTTALMLIIIYWLKVNN